MADFKTIAKDFVTFYYTNFDNKRQELAVLYREQSNLTFEEADVQGAAAIMEKITTLGFNQVRHEVTSIDAQPSPAGGLIVTVVGGLITDGEERPQNFVQTFYLMPEANGGFWVANDIFRLTFPIV
ncbi:nuclear transport factor NTF-2 [Penicillium sp. IBT 35674x]|nr:nuclear transport factor NTF-2 [Penicillium sp. IBT 35674x]